MSRILNPRLARLERNLKPNHGSFVTIWSIEDANDAEPVRLESDDGRYIWTRACGECAVNFEERVRDEAGRLGKTVIVLSIEDRNL